MYNVVPANTKLQHVNPALVPCRTLASKVKSDSTSSQMSSIIALMALTTRSVPEKCKQLDQYRLGHTSPRLTTILIKRKDECGR